VQALAWNGEHAETIFNELIEFANKEKLIPILDTTADSHFTEEFEAERNIIESLERVGIIYKIEGDEVNYLKIVQMIKDLEDTIGGKDYGYYWPGEQLRLGVLALEVSRGNDEALIEEWNKTTQETTTSKNYVQLLGEMIIYQASWSTLEKNGVDLLNVCNESQLFCREYLRTAERYEENGNQIKAKETMHKVLNLIEDLINSETSGYGMDSWMGIIYSHPLSLKYLEIGYEEIEILEEEVLGRAASGRSSGFMNLMKAYANRGWVAEIDRIYRKLEGKPILENVQILRSSYCTAMMRAGAPNLVKGILNLSMADKSRLNLILSLGYEASEYKQTLEASLILLRDVANLEDRMANNFISTSTSQLGIEDQIILERHSTNELAVRILRQCLKFRRVDLIKEVLEINKVSDESKVNIMWETYLHLRRNIGSINFVL